MRDPLITRSLPGHLWENVPREIIEFDHELRENILHWSKDYAPSFLKWLIESPVSITIFFIATIMLYLSKQRRLKVSFNKSLVLKKFFFITLSLGASDLVSYRLKIWIGRLKPHVDYYNPEFLPALSLPSNHAFNTSCLFFLLLLTSNKPLNKTFFAGLALISIFIGVSRVSLGQHYPLDVVAGWLLGSIFATLAVKIETLFTAYQHAQAERISHSK
ncbi:phosphatase PAP2 family protein [bacterium]|nr:phosphatase PAP2 family protein [bacterium]